MSINQKARVLKETCPLCSASSDKHLFIKSVGRNYFNCNQCSSWFLSLKDRLSPTLEKARYDEHQNSPEDPRYRNFLSQVSDPLSKKLKPGDKGLDFGSGPGPTLHLMMQEMGFKMDIYDPFFNPDLKFEKSYDFITCTETAEHFFKPLDEFSFLFSKLKPGRWMGLMTDLLQVDTDFENWYYTKDPSHTFFYSQETFEFIADRFSASLETVGSRVILLQKSL